MSIYKLIPALKDYIWGGTKLKEYRQSDLDKISEYPANSTTARTGPPAMIPVP